jgi:hypothetical protein
MTTELQYAEQLVSFGEAQDGKPYVYGASGPSAWDCSGLTMMAAASIGVPMEHGSAAQFNIPQAPKVTGALQPGDFSYFWGGESSGPRPGHVGIFVGVIKGAYTMIDAYDEAQGVRYNTFAPVVSEGAGLSYMGSTRPALWGKSLPHPTEPTLFLRTPYMTGAAVVTCQRRLIVHGEAGSLGPSQADGQFGPCTRRAVELFQFAAKLTVDGIVGAHTWGKLLA